jgi:hypothetical protein
MISVNRLVGRKSNFDVGEWVMDSGAFTALAKHGRHVMTVQDYAAQIRRWWRCGYLAAAVCQDWMCEPFMLAKTGLTVADGRFWERPVRWGEPWRSGAGARVISWRQEMGHRYILGKGDSVTEVDDPLAPAGGPWRLLLQLVDESTLPAARERLVRIFGPAKGNAAVIVPGTIQPENPNTGAGKWRQWRAGFRAYLKLR